MKKIIFSLFAIAFSLTLTAQEIWLEAGLKGGAGMSFLLNKNIQDDGSHDYVLTPTYGVGGRFALNFGPNHGITMEGMYNQIGQDWEYSAAGQTGLTNELRLKSIDAYLLYRYTSFSTYLEIGPMYSFNQSVDQKIAGVEVPTDGFYEDSYLAGVFGFGGKIAHHETFSTYLGFRAHYGFTDIVTDLGWRKDYPNPIASYTAQESTNPVFVQVLAEFNFGLGRFAKTACADRWRLRRGRR